MTWLVTGARGMLGVDLVQTLHDCGHDVVATDRAELDIVAAAAVDALVADVQPTVVVNCAAWTNVDGAEEHEPDAFMLNAVGPANLARAAHRHGARIVQISTDYVFEGTANEPYAEYAPPAPRSAYGRTKAAGEWAVRAEATDHLIVRTAWLYGASGRCFPKTIARAAAERGQLDVVSDQLGAPTWTCDLAQFIVDLVNHDAPAGIYHGTAGGVTSWFAFAQAVVTAQGMDPALVRPQTSDEAARSATRPAYSVLAHERQQDAGVPAIGDWEDRWAVAAEHVLRGV